MDLAKNWKKKIVSFIEKERRKEKNRRQLCTFQRTRIHTKKMRN